MKTLGIIVARGGSKGIPNKNLRELAGRPLLAYTSESANASGVINRLIISTDSPAIARLAVSLGIEVPFRRPDELARDETPMLPVLQHAVQMLEREGWIPDIVVLLQPTSPLRKPKHIQQALRLLHTNNTDSVVSVVEIPHIFAPQKALQIEKGFLQFVQADGEKVTRRQELETTYAREGTVYALWRTTLMEKNSIYGERCKGLVVPMEESLTLDNLDDWERAERLFQWGQRQAET